MKSCAPAIVRNETYAVPVPTTGRALSLLKKFSLREQKGENRDKTMRDLAPRDPLAQLPHFSSLPRELLLQVDAPAA